MSCSSVRPSREAPEPVSVRMTSQPASLSRAFWISRSWVDELTRAYQMRGMAACHIRVAWRPILSQNRIAIHL